MDDELLEKVKDFVADFWREPKGMLSAETSVNGDLGMDGDDALEFMQAFGERFAVDLTSFPYDRYFGPEAGANPFSIVEGIIRRVATGKSSALASVTLRDLTEAAERRSWPVGPQPEI